MLLALPGAGLSCCAGRLPSALHAQTPCRCDQRAAPPHPRPLPTPRLATATPPARPPAGDVRVNWRPGAKPSAEVKAGDLISVAGKGRLEVQAADVTGKGKYRVRMRRLL